MFVFQHWKHKRRKSWMLNIQLAYKTHTHFSSVFVFVFYALLCVRSSFVLSWRGRGGWLLCYYCLTDVLLLKCSVDLTHDAVCDRGISWSYSLTFWHTCFKLKGTVALKCKLLLKHAIIHNANQNRMKPRQLQNVALSYRQLKAIGRSHFMLIDVMQSELNIQKQIK